MSADYWPKLLIVWRLTFIKAHVPQRLSHEWSPGQAKDIQRKIEPTLLRYCQHCGAQGHQWKWISPDEPYTCLQCLEMGPYQPHGRESRA